LRIGVLSDTHVSSFAELSDKIVITLAEMDMIIHAGDFTTREVLDGLKQLGKVSAVCGNMDSNELKRLLPEREFTHGGWEADWGYSWLGQSSWHRG